MILTKEQFTKIHAMEAGGIMDIKDDKTGELFRFEKDDDYRPEEDKEYNNMVSIYYFRNQDEYDLQYAYGCAETIHLLNMGMDLDKIAFYDAKKHVFYIDNIRKTEQNN